MKPNKEMDPKWEVAGINACNYFDLKVGNILFTKRFPTQPTHAELLNLFQGLDKGYQVFVITNMAGNISQPLILFSLLHQSDGVLRKVTPQPLNPYDYYLHLSQKTIGGVLGTMFLFHIRLC